MSKGPPINPITFGLISLGLASGFFIFLFILITGLGRPTSLLPTSDKIPTTISFEDAKDFAKTRCYRLNQKLIDTKAVNFQGTKMYVFLSESEEYPDYMCVFAITDKSYEVNLADCGKSAEKLKSWDTF